MICEVPAFKVPSGQSAWISLRKTKIKQEESTPRLGHFTYSRFLLAGAELSTPPFLIQPKSRRRPSRFSSQLTQGQAILCSTASLEAVLPGLPHCCARN